MLWDEPKIFFLERRYFFSIILSEFLKNRVALQLRPLPENVAIILDFFRNVKMKSEQIIDKLYNKNVD